MKLIRISPDTWLNPDNIERVTIKKIGTRYSVVIGFVKHIDMKLASFNTHALAEVYAEKIQNL